MTGEQDAAAAGVGDLYRRHGGDWLRLRLAAAFSERGWFARFLEAAPPPRRILDLGCGAGAPVAAFLVESGASVAGIDSAPEMIAQARARLPRQEWRVADMRGLNLARRFDGLVAWDSFFHLAPDDQRAMFAVFAAHAAPGAALIFTSGPRFGVAIGELMGEPLFHASLDPDEYRALLAAHGFDVMDHRADDADCGGRTVWLARRGG